MSAGAVFKLIANDGKADRMIMATTLLNQRIKDVMCARKREGKGDITPTLVDLERTHVVFVNAHYKPFAAIGYEYNKVRPQSGSATLGNGLTFSIPQFGDFFHDMVARTRLSQAQANVGTTPLQAVGSESAPAAFPANGTDAYGNRDDSLFYNIVDATGHVIVLGGDGTVDDPFASPVQYRNFVRYCEFPGNRLFRQVKFDVNGNPLDQYDDMVPVMLEKFATPPNKRVGHDRLVGQEVPLIGYGGLKAATVFDANAANTPAGITRFASGQSNYTVALYNEAADQSAPQVDGISGTATAPAALNASGGPQVDVARQMLLVCNGPQTPKPVQPPLELWNKLRFWFNEDVRLSVPSVSIPFGQRFISIDLAQQSQLLFETPSIYLQTIVDPVAPAPAGGPTGVRQITYSPIFIPNGVGALTIEAVELYINNIFVNPEVHDIFIKRIGFSLIRVYRQHVTRVNQSSQDEKLLSQLKWPIEYMMVGFRPAWNIQDPTGSNPASGNQNVWHDWHRLTRQVDAFADSPSLAQTPSGAAVAASGSSVGQVQPDRYWLPVSAVDTLSLTSHGIVIYDKFQDKFYNAYQPFHYGGTSLVTPDDTGALFVNMSLFPRSYQPSGHLNVSRARETYLQWTTSYISANTPADLHCVGVAINFLLITDGSAVLRYST